MRATPNACRIAGAFIALVVTAPVVARMLEANMSTHMLVQIPLLMFAGPLIGLPLKLALPLRSWNFAGVPVLLAVSLTVTYWMTPIALDHAAANAGWDAAKSISLILSGALALESWRRAPLVVQVFFGGNAIWMGVAAGLLYQARDQRLCNAYLLDDQVSTGVMLLWISIAIGTAWGLRLATDPHGGHSGRLQG